MKLCKKAVVILFTIMISACGGGDGGVPTATDSPTNEQKLAVWGNFSWDDESAWQ